MRNHRQKYEIKSEINIVPFLDILLILLTVFMLMPSKIIQGFEIYLPNSEQAIDFVENNEKFIIIEIKEIKFYNLIIDGKTLDNMCLEELSKIIQFEVMSKPNLKCLIAASKSAKYEKVIQVLNILNKIGLHSIGMITNPIVIN